MKFASGKYLFKTTSWAGPKGVPLPKPGFIHGNQIDAPVNYVPEYYLFKYVNGNGKEVIATS